MEQGDGRAAAELLPLVYEELRRLAAAKMARERPDQTLQPTALVHEAWLRLVGAETHNWNCRAHFFGAAAEAMRRILIENARRKLALREFEAFAETRIRASGAQSDRITGNFTAAVFTHDTSRALDPHLHTHCIVFNATFDPVENRWKALQNYELLG